MNKLTRTAAGAALTLIAGLALTACSGSTPEAGQNDNEQAGQQTQVFYQTNYMGQGDSVDRQLVIDGTSVSVYSLNCYDGEAKFNTEGGWRGSLSADGKQIVWTEGESGTDDIVFAADGSSINLMNQPWKAMDEDAAIATMDCK